MYLHVNSSHQLEGLHSSLLSGIRRIVRKEMLSSSVTYSSSSATDSAVRGSNVDGASSSKLASQIASLKAEVEEKTDYCLKAVAQLNQSVFSTEKASSTSLTDVKDLQQQVTSMDKQLKVFLYMNDDYSFIYIIPNYLMNPLL